MFRGVVAICGDCPAGLGVLLQTNERAALPDNLIVAPLPIG